jgi:hypothetical protein
MLMNMKKYLVLALLVFVVLSGTALAKVDNDPLGKVWQAINELKGQKVSTYVQTADRCFGLSLCDGSATTSIITETVELLCDEGDTALSGSLDADPSSLDYIQSMGESPTLDSEGKSIGWKFTTKPIESTEIPVQVYVVCLNS